MSHNPMPGADVPGALSVDGDQAGRAGELVPGELRPVEATQGQPAQGQEQQTQPAKVKLSRKQKLEQMKGELKSRLTETCAPIMDNMTGHSHYAFRVYNSLIFNDQEKRLVAVADTLRLPDEDVIAYAKQFNSFKARSVNRIIKACEKTKKMKLIKFHSDFDWVFNRLSEIVRRYEDKEAEEIMNTLKKITVEQLLASWKGLKHRVERIDRTYDLSLASKITSSFDHGSYLYNTIVEELKKITLDELGADEDSVDTFIKFLPRFVYIEYSS